MVGLLQDFESGTVQHSAMTDLVQRVKPLVSDDVKQSAHPAMQKICPNSECINDSELALHKLLEVMKNRHC